MSKRVVDQSGQIVAPGASIEIPDTPEGESFEVRVAGIVLCGIEWHRLTVTVYGVGPAKRERRLSRDVGMEDLECTADVHVSVAGKGSRRNGAVTKGRPQRYSIRESRRFVRPMSYSFRSFLRSRSRDIAK